MKKIVITYGTFDLFHIGHVRLLNRLRELGDELIVAVSTDEFNEGKGKKTVIPFEHRIEIIRNLKCVDLAIPEKTWEQKKEDILRYGISIFGIGSDWEGKFDNLKEYCDVVYLPRTEGISSSYLKTHLHYFDQSHVEGLKRSIEIISSIVKSFG